MDGGLLGFLLLLCLCGLCTFPALLVASITFPASGLRIASDRVVVQWRVEYRGQQVVLSESGPSSRTPEYVVTLDGRPIVQSSAQAPRETIAILEDLEPGSHTLRLEAQAQRRRAVHEVTFEIVDAPSPWRLDTLPYAFRRAYVFDALGRALVIPSAEPADVAFADHRGVFEMWGAFTVQDKRLTFRPWIWEQVGEAHPLPLPADGQGYLVGPGFWLADRLYVWQEDTWEALPPLPAQVPEPVANYYQDLGPRLFQEHASFFWARACGDAIWVSLTWRIARTQGPDFFAYLARWRASRWERIPPPTPHGFFVPYCFHGQVWVVNVASDGSPLAAGQLQQWGWFINRQSPWTFVEGQSIGRTYRWHGAGWEEALAPPMVLNIHSQDNYQWLPSFYGPAFARLYQGEGWLVVIPTAVEGPPAR